MKVTKSQLRQIIKESFASIGREKPIPLKSRADSEFAKIIKNQTFEEQVSLEKGRDLDYGDGEARMTRSQLSRIASLSQSLHDRLLDNDDLPEWVQSKIAVAAEDIQDIHDYLDYKISRGSN